MLSFISGHVDKPEQNGGYLTLGRPFSLLIQSIVTLKKLRVQSVVRIIKKRNATSSGKETAKV